MNFRMSPLLLSVFAVLSFASASQAQTTPAPSSELSSPAVITSGEGVVRRAPDRAFVDVTVETRARSPRDAQAQNANQMSNVQQKLRAANLAKDAIRTLSFSVEPEFDFTNGRRNLRGYVARNVIELRIDDLPRLGEIMDIATDAGATSVGDIRFVLKDRKAVERQALGEAVTDARARAQAIVEAAGRTIVGIWRLVEEGATEPPPRPIPYAARAMAAEAQPTPVVAGEIEIRARVTLTVIVK